MPFSPAANHLVSLLIFFVGLGGVTAVVFAYAPVSASWIVYAALYSGVFLAISGLSFSVIFFLGRTFGPKSPGARTAVALRQAVMLGALAAVGLALQSLRLLNGYTLGLLVLCSGILELYFLSR